MKKILTGMLGLLSIFILTGCIDNYDVIDEDINGTFEVKEGINDATVTLIFDDEEIFGNKDIKIVVKEILNPINKYEQTYTNLAEEYIFDNLTEGTDYEAAIYVSGGILNIKISSIDFKTQVKAIEGEILFRAVSDTSMTVVIALVDESIITTEDIKIALTNGLTLINQDYVKGTSEYVFTGLTASTSYTAIFAYTGELGNNVDNNQATTKISGAVQLTGGFGLLDSNQHTLGFALHIDNFNAITDNSLVNVELRDESNVLIDTKEFTGGPTTYYTFTDLEGGTTYTAYLIVEDRAIYADMQLSLTTDPLTIITVSGNITVDTTLTTSDSITVNTSITGSLSGLTATLEIKDYVHGIVLTSETQTYVSDTISYVFNNLNFETEYEIYFVVEEAHENSNINVVEGNETTKLERIDILLNVVATGSIAIPGLTVRGEVSIYGDLDKLREYLGDGTLEFNVYEGNTLVSGTDEGDRWNKAMNPWSNEFGLFGNGYTTGTTYTVRIEFYNVSPENQALINLQGFEKSFVY